MNRSRKDITLISAMAALLVFAVFNFVFKPQRSDLSAARSDLQRVEQDISDAKLALQAPVTTAPVRAEASSTAIPEGPAVADLLRQLHAVAGTSGVMLGSIAPSPLAVNPNGPGGSVLLSISASGSHDAVLGFLQELRDMDRLATIEQIGTTRQPATDTTPETEQVQLMMRVFTQRAPAGAPVPSTSTSAP